MKSLLTPGHETSVATNKRDVVTATCTCGWSQDVARGIGAEREAGELSGKHLASAPRKPGLFRAVCRLSRWVPVDELGDRDPDAVQSRWDRKRECEVYLVQCDFSTDDRAAFDEHMKLHEDRPPMWDSPSLDPAAADRHIRNYRPRKFPVKPWKRPADKPFDAKSYAHEVKIEHLEDERAVS